MSFAPLPLHHLVKISANLESISPLVPHQRGEHSESPRRPEEKVFPDTHPTPQPGTPAPQPLFSNLVSQTAPAGVPTAILLFLTSLHCCAVPSVWTTFPPTATWQTPNAASSKKASQSSPSSAHHVSLSVPFTGHVSHRVSWNVPEQALPWTDDSLGHRNLPPLGSPTGEAAWANVRMESLERDGSGFVPERCHRPAV